MREQNFWLHVIIILSFVEDHNGHEIDEPYRCHLVLVDLGALDGDQLVADVFSDVEFAVGFKNVGDHRVILRFQKC